MTASELLYAAQGHPPVAGVTILLTSEFCWLCGAATPQGVARATAIKESFTNLDRAAVPTSAWVCVACAWCLDTKGLRTQGWCATPTLATALPTAAIRPLLLVPPDPPFLLLVPTSRKKHIWIGALVAGSRDYFPVRYEEQTVWIAPLAIAPILVTIERLLAWGLPRAAVATGHYEQRHLRKITDWGAVTAARAHLAPELGSARLGLLCKVAQGKEWDGDTP